jgi:prepilin-type N-terminal cleavage/methylation domain-containing protein
MTFQPFTNRMNTQDRKSQFGAYRGFTLVEILVVITIMSVLTLLIVPRVRLITKDRNIREAARVVGSMFANASQRAAAEGKKAGVLIRRNANFVDANYRDSNGQAIPYAATTLYLMRAVPDFTGDDASARATRISATRCRIDTPLDVDAVQVNDRIFLNNQRFGYRIKSIAPNDATELDLELETFDNSVYNSVRRTTYPPLGFSTPVTFRIERRPRIVASSGIDLPTGYQIDLRYSGWFVDSPGGFPPDSVTLMNIDNVNPDNDPTTINTDIQVVFNEQGGIESVEHGSDFNQKFLPTSSLYLFVTEDDLDLGANQDPLVRDSNLWVTVGNHNGGTSIGYNASPGNFIDNTNVMEMRNRITYARGLAANRQNASQ